MQVVIQIILYIHFTTVIIFKENYIDYVMDRIKEVFFSCHYVTIFKKVYTFTDLFDCTDLYTLAQDW